MRALGAGAAIICLRLGDRVVGTGMPRFRFVHWACRLVAAACHPRFRRRLPARADGEVPAAERQDRRDGHEPPPEHDHVRRMLDAPGRVKWGPTAPAFIIIWPIEHVVSGGILRSNADDRARARRHHHGDRVPRSAVLPGRLHTRRPDADTPRADGKRLSDLPARSCCHRPESPRGRHDRRVRTAIA
jgi:hypothetical protein